MEESSLLYWNQPVKGEEPQSTMLSPSLPIVSDGGEEEAQSILNKSVSEPTVSKPAAGLVRVSSSTASLTTCDSWDSSSNYNDDLSAHSSTPLVVVENMTTATEGSESMPICIMDDDDNDEMDEGVGAGVEKRRSSCKHNHDDDNVSIAGSIGSHLSTISMTSDTISITADTNSNKKVRLTLSEETINTLMIDTKTHFPHFLDLDELELLSDDELSDYDSDDEEYYPHNDDLLANLEYKYHNQEDKDVEVFSRIANRMDLTSLLHILQGHEQNGRMGTTSNMVGTKMDDQQTPVEKNFRWATATGVREDGNGSDDVHVDVIEIESFKDRKDLWWNAYEFNTIRAELLKTITIFTKYRQDYIDALKIVYKGLEPPEIIEENMKQYLSKESYHARGLESHMVSDLVKTKRMRHRKEVLRQQKVCKTRGDEYTKECNCLFQQSTLHTTMFIKFAERMGQFDEIESLLVNTTTTPATATI